MRKFLTISLIVLNSGCFHLSVQRGDPRPVTSTREFKVHSFLFTAIPGRQPPTMREVCTGTTSAETIEMKMSAIDVLISVATVGIYTPNSVKISCSAGPETKTVPTSSRQ